MGHFADNWGKFALLVRFVWTHLHFNSPFTTAAVLCRYEQPRRPRSDARVPPE